MSGAYRLIEVLKRLHPRFLFEESHGQLVDAFWASQDLGEPDLDPFTGEPFVHHPTKGQPFDPDVHKRHKWDQKVKPSRRMPWEKAFWNSANADYEEVEELADKIDVPRSAHSEAAHSHFTSALRKINQLDEGKMFYWKLKYDEESKHLDVESLMTAEQERNLEIEKGFNRYLMHRYRGAVVTKGETAAASSYSKAQGLKQSRRTIRTGTLNILSRTIVPWRSEMSLLSNWSAIFFLAYTLFFQIRGCQLILRDKVPWWSFYGDPKSGVDEDGARAASVRVFAVLFVKEIYPVTYYLFWLLSFLLLVVLGLAVLLLALILVAPALWLFEKMFGGDEQKRASNIASIKGLYKAVLKDPYKAFLHRDLAQLVQVGSLMALNLSSLYRIKELFLNCTARREYARQLKPSIRDGDNKLTSVSNVLFNLVLLSAGPVNANNLIASTIIALLMIFMNMVDEKQRNQDVADAMRDVNENRLSKFELALLITKIIDDVTLEEVQFNFVEHFYSDWLSDAKYRLDYVPTEGTDDLDSQSLQTSTEEAKEAARSARSSTESGHIER